MKIATYYRVEIKANGEEVNGSIFGYFEDAYNDLGVQVRAFAQRLNIEIAEIDGTRMVQKYEVWHNQFGYIVKQGYFKIKSVAYSSLDKAWQALKNNTVEWL